MMTPNSRQFYDLFTGDGTAYRQFIDELFNQRVQSVVCHVPFYRDLFAARGWTAAGFATIASLHKLPIVDRELVQAQPTERMINAVLDPASLPPPSYTSGTSGPPLKLYTSRDFYLASFYLLQRSYGGAVPFVAACVSDADRALPPADGCQLHFLSRNRTTAELFARLLELKPDLVMMRPDRWRLLIEEVGGELARLRLVVAGVSGMMTAPSERAYFATFLGCPVANMYGANELGGAIFECPAGREHVLAHHNFLEIVDDDDRAVAPGVTGHLVWTSLDNRIMPFVRYKIGDTGAFAAEQSCRCGWQGPGTLSFAANDIALSDREKPASHGQSALTRPGLRQWTSKSGGTTSLPSRPAIAAVRSRDRISRHLFSPFID